MFDDFSVQRQCQTCLAAFPTNEALRQHLEVYRVSTLQHQVPTADLLGVQLSELNEPHDSNNDTENDEADLEEGTEIRNAELCNGRGCPYCDKQ
ncbi:hypothetical protein AAE478_003250 [Parahypoxylon ruwenzoriense]